LKADPAVVVNAAGEDPKAENAEVVIGAVDDVGAQ